MTNPLNTSRRRGISHYSAHSIDDINRSLVDDANQIPAEGAHETVELIHAIMHLYRSQQSRVLPAGAADLTHLENQVMDFFAQRPGGTLTELATQSGRYKAQLARLIRSLRDQGLLEARADEADRRITRLHLTPHGQTMFGNLREQGAHLSSVAVTGLNDEERGLLVSLLERVRSNLAAQPDKPSEMLRD